MRSPLLLLAAAILLGLVAWWASDGGAPDALVLPTVTPDVPGPREHTRPGALPDEPAGVLSDLALDEPTTTTRKPAPIESCRLDLRFVHHLTGEPVEGQVQVWQLGVAEDEVWNAGDRRVFSGEAEGGKVELSGLDPGHYRAFAVAARRRSDSPPAFELHMAEQRHVWSVVPAGQEEMWLQVMDLTGVRIGEPLQIMNKGWDFSGVGVVDPDWAHERSKKQADEWLIGIGGRTGGRGFYTRSGRAWRELESDARGLMLGSRDQDTRTIGRNHHFDLRRAADSTSAGCSITVQPRGYQEFVTVLLSAEDLVAALDVTSREDLEIALDQLEFEAGAVALGADTGRSSYDAWRHVRVTARLDYSEFEPIEVTWQPGQEVTPRLVVRRKARGAAQD
jgi:hypothetical protein